MKLSADELYDVLLIFRDHLVPCWQRFHEDERSNLRWGVKASVPEVVSALTCRHTSAFLYKHLSGLGVEDLQPCGGLMRHAQPLDGDDLIENDQRDLVDPARLTTDEDGYVWEPHFWLEHNGMVIDMTKDQFGWAFDDLHDLETAEIIYQKNPDRCRMAYLRALKTTVSKFEGKAQTARQEYDPHFESVRASFAHTMERVKAIVGERVSAPEM